MQMRWVTVAALGVAITIGAGCASGGKEQKDGDEQDIKVPMDQVPAAVKATLNKEAKGGKVGEVEKEVENGKTIYSADVTIDGKEYDVKVAEDGKLIEKKVDDGKPEKDEAK